MDIPTDLPRTQDPPEHDTQLPAATSPTAEPPQTPDEEARDILAKAIRNQAEDGPSTRRAAIRAYKYLHAMVRQHGPQLQTVYEASKAHATRSKGIQESLKYRAQPQESLLSHHNSRLSCYTACPPCLTRGPWPKSPSTWTRQVNGYQKWEDFFLRMSTFSVQDPNTATGSGLLCYQSWVSHVGYPRCKCISAKIEHNSDRCHGEMSLTSF